MRFNITIVQDHEEAKRIMRFASRTVGMEHAGVLVRLGQKPFGGRAYSTPYYQNVGREAKKARRYVRMNIAATGWPVEFRGRINGRKNKRGKMITLSDWKEALVWLSAHEFMHVVQYDTKDSPHSVEGQCDWHANYVLALWRKKGEEVQ